MKKKFYIFLFVILAAFPLRAEERNGWGISGELPYSYPYARTWVGGKMRQAGWKCIKAFTSGKKNEIEHSIWEKGTSKLQMMLWRIASDKTGYSQRSLTKSKTDKIL
ncbi:MAG: hypothetical protein IJV93_05750 [Lentisphaeria bacterium]|nr:hypothetical protein [Lentisphaeria bacterium]